MDWTDLPLARATVDRAAERRTEPDLVQRLLAEDGTRVLLVHRGLVATTTQGDAVALELFAPSAVGHATGPGRDWLFLGTDGPTSYLGLVLADLGTQASDAEGFVVEPGPDLVPGREWSHLRTVGARLTARDAGLATTAVALASWHTTHQRCPRCGSVTEPVQGGWVRRCPVDASDHYPRTDPAVIMAVVDDADRILLGHAGHWPERRFSTLAGYVEPGEPLEHAVRREVAEEVGVTVGAVSYRGSQPWPFPASLMLAFRAVALTSAITVDGTEITEARWFTRAELGAAASSGEVLLPMRASIARALVEEWFGGELPGD
ncbi:NAD(+) diphosphatase [Cellulomonas fimi]|uniref:NAD(+) diphosphatase n=1 Tax=Cellulomonas fimi TaxID=1708 RepID=A0A7Y0QGL8_CELFI|nr:NAD(+) diphosphatase [Cellulomonas fimi]NMR19019.1 NAD(+) diphosphatase [Cellulomonas fimi]